MSVNFLVGILSGLAAMTVLPVLASSAETGGSARDTVKWVTDDLLEKLIEVQPLYESDREEFFREVDISMGQFIDFGGFSRGVMAKYYRRASGEQRVRFAMTFRDTLIRTYAKVLVEFDNQQVIVLPGNKQQKDDRKARVRLEVYGSNGSVYPIEYSMVRVDEKWKLRNIVIAGINIGLQFRSQFAASMQKYKNDIDQVIENWNVDV